VQQWGVSTVPAPALRAILHAGGDSSSAQGDIADHLGSPRHAVFIPYALHDWEAYVASAQERRYDALGIDILGIHRFDDPVSAIRHADAIIVGGGNSFRLVSHLHGSGLIEPIREVVTAGVPYYGGSAGANVACPTIRTTNDMPIVQPVSLNAIGLVPFQINPHYVDPPPVEARVGETRAERIAEFLEENEVPVIGLREGSWLFVNGRRVELRGGARAVLFRRNQLPDELDPGSDLSFLMDVKPHFDMPVSRERSG
jgi:dipeptidase E